LFWDAEYARRGPYEDVIAPPTFLYSSFDGAIGIGFPSVQQITMTAYYETCIGSPGHKAGEISWLYRTWAFQDPGRPPNNYDATYFSERVLPSRSSSPRWRHRCTRRLHRC
jgi:hypothetical protein